MREGGGEEEKEKKRRGRRAAAAAAAAERQLHCERESSSLLLSAPSFDLQVLPRDALASHTARTPKTRRSKRALKVEKSSSSKKKDGRRATQTLTLLLPPFLSKTRPADEADAAAKLLALQMEQTGVKADRERLAAVQKGE